MSVNLMEGVPTFTEEEYKSSIVILLLHLKAQWILWKRKLVDKSSVICRHEDADLYQNFIR